ncbi:MAG: hypothetical protein JJ863_23180 [Deltaproteobacteria bacterium]|nr:hypothetical protein [Deltaproteobacteria bacterium]
MTWTKAQRGRLTAILHPHDNDPAVPVRSGLDAWKAAKLGAKPPKKPSFAHFGRTQRTEALVDYWVSEFGLLESLRYFLENKPKKTPWSAILPFRRHLIRAEDHVFRDAVALLFDSPEDMVLEQKAVFAWVASRDPSLAHRIADDVQARDWHSVLLLPAIRDPEIALRMIERVGLFPGFHPAFDVGAFDLVESLGSGALPIGEALVARDSGMAKARRRLTEAMAIAETLPDRSERSPARSIPAGKETAPAALSLNGVRVAVSGEFSDLSQAELTTLLLARGAWVGPSVGRRTRYLFSADPSSNAAVKARALSQPVIDEAGLRDALGPPLHDFRARLEQAAASSHVGSPLHFHVGDPTPCAIERIEERIGFALPPDGRAFFEQIDGLGWARTWRPTKVSDSDAERLIDARPNWPRLRDVKKLASLACVLPIETMFFHRWDGDLFTSDAYAPNDTIDLGIREVSAHTLLSNLFLFDDFSEYYCAALWADPETERLFILYGTDHGSDFGLAQPVPFEVYLEHLIVDSARTRCLNLVSKLGATKDMHAGEGGPWLKLFPFDQP